MTVQCMKCSHVGSASKHQGSAFSTLWGADRTQYACARCGSGDLRKVQYCTKCGHVGVPHIETVKEFSVGLFVVLLVFGILPGLIYLALGGSSQPYYECTQCRGRLVLIPVDSPVAQGAIDNKPQRSELQA